MTIRPRPCARPTTSGVPCPLLLPPAGACASPLHADTPPPTTRRVTPPPTKATSDGGGFDDLVRRARRHRIRLRLRNAADTAHNRHAVAAALDQVIHAIEEGDLHRRRSKIRVRTIEVVGHDQAAFANLRLHHRNDMRATVGVGRRLATVWRYHRARRHLRRELASGEATIAMAEAEASRRRWPARTRVTLRLTYDPASGRIHDGAFAGDGHDIAVHDLDSLLVHEMTHIRDFAALPSFTPAQKKRWRRCFESALHDAYGRRTTKQEAAPTRYARTDPREFVAEVAVLLADPARAAAVYGPDTLERAGRFAAAYNRAAGRIVLERA